MQIDYSKRNLPPIYKRNRVDCYLDPIRKRLINITPEETVRQQVIDYLINITGVPLEFLQVEQHLSHYDGVNSKRRADIVIERLIDSNTIVTLAIIECKAPGVALDEKAINQSIDYSNELLSDYIMITNGCDECFFKYDEATDRYILAECLPTYREMLRGEYIELPPPPPFERLAYSEIRDYIESVRESVSEGDYFSDISIHTPLDMAVMAYNFMETLRDTRYQMPAGDYGYFKLIKDEGNRFLSYGNHSGFSYSGYYRSFLIEVNGSTEFVSMAVIAYNQGSKPMKTNTSIAVAIDNELTSHHSLQFGIEENIVLNGDKFKFYHNGKIALGHSGSGKSVELREFVKKEFSSLVSDNKIYLGELRDGELWGMSDPKFIELAANFITYALIRDKFRKMKSGK